MNMQQEDNPDRHHLNISFVAILGLMLFCSAATIFWGADRSLGLGDEGVYLLAARYPAEIQQNVSSVYIYTGYLFRLANYNPVEFRLLGVILVCISAFVFWLGLYKFISESYLKVNTVKYLRLSSLFFIEFGALLLYQWFYLTPNYNSLIGMAINISAGSILWGWAQIGNWQKNTKSIILAFIFGGLAIGLALFTKFPAGICLLLLYTLVIVLWREINRYQRIILSGALFAGVTLWFAGHFFFIQPPQIWWQMLKEGWSLYQAFGAYAPQSKYIVYVNELSFFVYSAIEIYWPCYLILCIAFVYNFLKDKDRKFNEKANSHVIFIALLCAVLLSANAGIFIDERKSPIGSIPFYLLFHFAWILLLLTAWIFNFLNQSSRCNPRNNTSVKVNNIIVLGLLVALPIAGSVGTQNPLYNVPLCQASTWFGAIIFLLVILTISERDNLLLRMFSLFSIGAFTASQIIQGYIFDPQTAVTDLFHQVEATEVGNPAKTLKLDMEEHELVNKLSSIAKGSGFKPGGDVIAFNFIPGLVYAIGGRSPGHPTFISGGPKREAYSRLALQYADIERLKKAYVLLDVEPILVESMLTSRGLNFPKGYEKIGAVVSRGTSYSLWKPAYGTKD